MKSVLLYNLYLVNNWQSVTKELLNDIPHNDIYINISYDLRYIYKIPSAILFLRRYKKVKYIYITSNNAKYGEVLGFEKFRQKIDYTGYDILTYMHSKGVTKPHNQNVSDWRELLRYFTIDKFDVCVRAFEEGYQLYGVNYFEEDKINEKKYAFRHSEFIFRGNFVSLNLNLLREQFISTPIHQDYYSVEGFWGKLCTKDKVFCPHLSPTKHYEEPYPEHLYKKNKEIKNQCLNL